MSVQYGEYVDIEKYKSQLVGKTIESVSLNENADDGLIVNFTSGAILIFGFSSCEGSFEIVVA